MNKVFRYGSGFLGTFNMSYITNIQNYIIVMICSVGLRIGIALSTDIINDSSFQAFVWFVLILLMAIIMVRTKLEGFFGLASIPLYLSVVLQSASPWYQISSSIVTIGVVCVLVNTIKQIFGKMELSHKVASASMEDKK